MAGTVKQRLGSVFIVDADILVVPCSTSGTVPRLMKAEFKAHGIPTPPAMPLGEVQIADYRGDDFVLVVFAAAFLGLRTSREIVLDIGRQLGELAEALNLFHISAPSFGVEGSGLSPTAAAVTLARGFEERAPTDAELTIMFDTVTVPTEAAFYTNPSPTPVAVPPVNIETRKFTARVPKPKAQQGKVEQASTAEERHSELRETLTRHRIFISYSHEDGEWLGRLQRHLRPIERQGAVVWDDTRLRAGARWRDEIRAALAETKVAILLISADFLASDFIVTDELPPLLKAASEDGATILPVIISPCRFRRMESLSCFQAVNDPDKPLVQLRRANREKVLDDVARAVEDALKR